MNILENKVAIVTGASSGIGRAAARLFAEEGGKVVASGRRGDELDALVGEITAAGGGAIAHAALHLASDASSFMIGASILVDGGISISRA